MRSSKNKHTGHYSLGVIRYIKKHGNTPNNVYRRQSTVKRLRDDKEAYCKDMIDTTYHHIAGKQKKHTRKYKASTGSQKRYNRLMNQDLREIRERLQDKIKYCSIYR